MAGVVKLVVALTLVLRSVMAQPDTSAVVAKTGCGSSFVLTKEDYTTDYPNSVDRCSGKIQAEISNGLFDVCAVMTDIAAERACWDAGVNLDMGRNLKLSRCAKHQLAVTTAISDLYVNIQTVALMPNYFASQDQYDCVTAGVNDCFKDCYTDVFTAGTPTANNPTTAGDCERPIALGDGDRALAAVVCFDRNECVEGLLYSCTGPFDEDCTLGKPCVDNAVCSNTPDSYTCTCESGYEPANAIGAYQHLGAGAECIDIDECATGAHTCGTDICQNTIGSFVCVCNSWKLFNNPGGPDECEEVECAELPVLDALSTEVAEDKQAESATITCNTGYRASNNPSSNQYTLTCRDGQWCSCIQPYCEPKPCGDPGTDPFASHPETLGLEGMTVEYKCQEGYEYAGTDKYTKTCIDGSWDEDNAKCTAIDLCGTSPCGTNAECTNIPGSFICKCNRGYKGDGITPCVVEDLCVDLTPCDSNADCTSYIGSYTCNCILGYTGDGKTCTAINCGNPPDVDDSDDAWVSGNTVEYTCKEGFYASSLPNGKTFELKCEQNGQWEPQPTPSCRPFNCGDPGIVKNAIRSDGGFLYGDKFTYTCLPGFRVRTSYNPPSFEVTCQDGGDWTQLYECEDVKECAGSPCGGGNHYCIETEGSYRCSCAPGYRQTNDGRSCESYPAPWGDFNWREAPCDFYNTLQLCDRGTCRLDASGYAKCNCDEGYSGQFCTEWDYSSWQAYEVMAVVALVLSCIAILCILIVCLCMCNVGGPGPGRNAVVKHVDHGHYGLPTRIGRGPYKPGHWNW